MENRCLDLLFSFDGRVGRSTYWASLGGYFVVLEVMVQGGLLVFPHTAAGIDRLSTLFGFVGLVCLWPMLAIQTKRWHDRAKSGWWFLLNVIPVVGPIWTTIELGFLGPVNEGNKY
jgi:uncharacterized membrane protein YhaH (DUF805 family)